MACGCAEIAAGVVGLAKVAAQSIGVTVDAAPAEVVEARRASCRTCPLASRSARFAAAPHRGLSTLSTCAACGCLIAAKTRLASSACRLGWWLPAGER